MTVLGALLWDGAASLVPLGLAFAQPLFGRFRGRRRGPVTGSNRRLRDKRANVVLNADPGTIAFALGPHEAQLASLQEFVDRLAENDHADDEPRHTR